MREYLSNIWKARYFWLHLARAELMYKFRRSKLGLLWTTINPLVLTLMMTFIFSNLFKVQDNYAPYVYSGLLVWEFCLSSVMGGCQSILGSEVYIKQYKHPFAIYPLKTTVVNITTLAIALPGLLLWILLTKPANLLISIFALPVSMMVLFIIGWPISIITSFIHLKYRDFGQVAALGMQLIWYMSPIFFEAKMIKAINLAYLVEFNPVTHILNLIRAPLLYGKFPSLIDFGFVIGSACVLYLFALYKIKSSEKTLIFYF